MKLGVIGPEKSIEIVSDVVRKNFKYIELVSLKYNIYKEAPVIVEKFQGELDGILFTGTTPFIFASKLVIPSIPWEYIPSSHESSLLNVLLKASALKGYDISRISFDSYNSDLLYEAYGEIGIEKDKLNISIAEEKILDNEYIDYLYNFHKQNYSNGRVSCCITGIESVYKKLLLRKIPCFKSKNTSNIIREMVTKLKLKHLVHINQTNQIVVLVVEMDLPDEQSIINKNEYQMALKNMKISEQIYLFAQRIQAAVIELSFGNYILFSTRSILESETNNLREIELISMINKNTTSTVSIGIGYGRTAREAKYGANLGKERAKKCGGNRVFVVYEGEKIIGPINNLQSNNEKEEQIDEKFIEIARKSGLGINTIFKLHSIVKQYRLNSVTPSELARLYGITLRSMNRIIRKLEQSGYVKIVGRKSPSDVGRPSRIIHILF
ncbi:MAG: hypothetical protein N4A57_16065 [Anaeromicrobium sp.]|jgi:ribosomal protein S25|uniref:hypothetical protein n=1 Tax=Anaeromicrobium sp. TaxID=1929132 RepID=UPI0025F7FC48|nr:hypothetical protein [Anaeromicrobium sp.]MCT4595764.1 hypothetical protein [Anaeromicrobium sp.]